MAGGDVGQSLKDEDLVLSLQRICAERGLPGTIKTERQRIHFKDNG